VSMFWPTTTISILRGTTTTPAGDQVDTDVPLYTGVLASVMERTRTGIDSLAQDMRVYRYTVMRVAAGTDILDTDRVLDEKTNIYYAVSAVSVLGSPIHTPDLRVDLTRVN
jgi:hypothetical protein